MYQFVVTVLFAFELVSSDDVEHCVVATDSSGASVHGEPTVP